MKKFAFGIDLGGTTIKIGIFQSDGKLLDKWEIPTNTYNHGEQILADIASALDEKLTTMGINKSEVAGAGIGVPGAVLNDAYVKECENLDHWGEFNVSEALESLCDFPVKVTNDANAAALGEMWQGGAKGYQNAILVTLGTGVGGGIIIDGKVVSGAHGAAGEIGHIKVRRDETELCGCGQTGCLEQYASATGVVRCAKKLIELDATPSKLRDFEAITAKSIFDLAYDGDILALKIVDSMFDDLGRALAAVSCVCDPEVIVIGGGVSKAGNILIEGVQKSFVKYAFPASVETKFHLASLGNDAGIYGAVHLMLEF